MRDRSLAPLASRRERGRSSAAVGSRAGAAAASRLVLLVAALLACTAPTWANEVACTESAFEAEIARINACTGGETQGACVDSHCSNAQIDCTSDADCDCTPGGKTITFSCAASCTPWEPRSYDPDCLILLSDMLDDGSLCSKSNAGCCDNANDQVDGCSTALCEDDSQTDSCCVRTGCNPGDPPPCTTADYQCTAAGEPWTCCTGPQRGTCCRAYSAHDTRTIEVDNVTLDGEGKVVFRLDPCCWHRRNEFGFAYGPAQDTNINAWTPAVFLKGNAGLVKGLRWDCTWEGVSVLDGDNNTLDGCMGWASCDDAFSVTSVVQSSTGNVIRNSRFELSAYGCIETDSEIGGPPADGTTTTLTIENTLVRDCDIGIGVADNSRVRVSNVVCDCTGETDATPGACYEPYFDEATGKGFRDTYVVPTDAWRSCGNVTRCGNGGCLQLNTNADGYFGNTLIDHQFRHGVYLSRGGGSGPNLISEGCNVIQHSREVGITVASNGKVVLENDTIRYCGGADRTKTGLGGVHVQDTASLDAGGGALVLDGHPLSSAGGNQFYGNTCETGTGICHIQHESSGSATADDKWWGQDADPCPGDDDCGTTCPPSPPGNQACNAGGGSLSTLPRLAADPGSCNSLPGLVPGLVVEGGGTIGWSPLVVATSYDVVLGDLQLLRATGGDFTTSLADCLENDGGDARATHAFDPPEGQRFYYLVRGSVAGQAGTYDSGGLGQAAPRDSEIRSAAAACR